jgi:hypothetical protein
MDVTHIPSFGQHCYVHVSLIQITSMPPHMLEGTKHVIAYCLAAFATMSKPQELKTDNVPA